MLRLQEHALSTQSNRLSMPVATRVVKSIHTAVTQETIVLKKLQNMDAATKKVNVAFAISSSPPSFFWLAVILSVAFRPCWRKVSRCVAKVMKSKTQPALSEPMIQMPSSLERYVDQEFVLKQTVDSYPATPDEEPADELGVFGEFVNLFGMQWIRSVRVTR